MGRDATLFECASCGATRPQWQGFCERCGVDEPLIERPPSGIARGGGGNSARRRAKRPQAATSEPLNAQDAPPPRRMRSGIAELDRALGGGIVAGATMLLGGEPGIGKSTLALQAAASVAKRGEPAVYVSGEESLGQLRLRAGRLNAADAPVAVISETRLPNVLAALEANPPRLAVIDSAHTLWTPDAEGSAGGIAQLRVGAESLAQLARRDDIAMILIAHVTKDGQIAGPKAIEHVVDAVLYFESDAGGAFRAVRTTKNRFGPSDEIGVFAMTAEGLREVPDPSALLLGTRRGGVGSASFVGIEGSRPIMAEFQALTVDSSFPSPRRSTVGWGGDRLAALLAALRARCGLSLAAKDVYLNVGGGLKPRDPAADLAAAAAIVSSTLDAPLPADAAFFGEASLSGDLRAASRTDARLRELARLGFANPAMPAEGINDISIPRGITPRPFADLAELVAWIAALKDETQRP